MAPLEQRLRAFVIVLRLLGLGDRLFLVRLGGLVHRADPRDGRFELDGIDLEQELPLLNDLPFLHRHLRHLADAARADIDLASDGRSPKPRSPS